MNLAWALRRASVMSSREICHRAVRQMQWRLEQLGFGLATPPGAHEVGQGRAWADPLPVQFEPDAYVAAADRILAGQFEVFALRPVSLGFPPQWNRDPKTGREAPLVFGKTLNYRDEALVGDIKYLWEPARHAELTTLAQAWRLTHDDRYSAGCLELLESWFEQCPYPLGPHWTSSLELGLRLVNWSFAWFLLGGDDAPLFRTEKGLRFRKHWLESVYRHSHFIAGHLSRYSSANNHLLGELLGLFVASLTWPYWRESARWAQQASDELQEQALLQNGPDGVNREQALWYHHEVADMLLIAGLFGRGNGLDFSREYWRRLEAMLDFIASVMDHGGSVPAFGDADDAVIARLDPSDRPDVYSSLLVSGAVVFERPDLASKVARFDDKSRWLLGDQAAERFSELRRSRIAPRTRRAFEDAGYYVLGGAFDSVEELKLVFDAGPLGYESIAAHGHADALSFTLSAGGLEFLIDPGTYAYHTQKTWRNYFRGTSAHNTMRVDGLDQSTIGGAFLWLRHARSRVIEYTSHNGREVIRAEHDGYTRLSDPVVHRRELLVDGTTGEVRVTDEACCEGEHELEFFWHFSEQCEVRLEDREAVATRGGTALVIALPHDAQCELARGDANRPLGWRSLRFDERVPCITLRASVKVRGGASVVTHMKVRKRAGRTETKAAADAVCVG